MQSESLREYEFIRHELDGLKSCITTYVGFVIGGTGAAVFFGFANVAPQFENFRAVAYTSLLLALLLNFVLSVLMYKFNSHNRYCGYCVVIDHERFTQHPGTPPTLLTWEIALGKLRFAARDSQWLTVELARLKNEIKQADIQAAKLSAVLAYYTGRHPRSDRWHVIKGMRALVRAVLGLGGARSWGFPPVVVAIFFLISATLMLVGVGTATAVLAPQWAVADEKILSAVVLVTVTMYLVVWYRFLGKFHDLMAGSATINAFAWRFLLIRIGLLVSHQLTPSFPFVDQHLKDELSWIKKRKRGLCWCLRFNVKFSRRRRRLARSARPARAL